MGDEVILHTLSSKGPWLGGILLFFISIAFIAVPLFKGPVERSNDGNSATSVAHRHTHWFPIDQVGKTSTVQHISTKATRNGSSNLNSQEKQTLVRASLHRHDNPNSTLSREGNLPIPAWKKIINPREFLTVEVTRLVESGTRGIPNFIHLYHVVEAEFIQKKVSDGMATDMSALLPGPLADITNAMFQTKGDHALNNFPVFERIARLDGVFAVKTGLSQRVF